MLSLSIIVCTKDREGELAQTLRALSRVVVPAEASLEVLVVDNGSTDGTPGVIEAAERSFPALNLVSLHEPRRGKSHALNRALGVVSGEVILFTDDDVRPPPDWIEGMVAPILEGGADAVAGGIRLAAHLKRPYLSPDHEKWLASTEHSGRPEWHPLIGANMALHRRVFEGTGGFDPEIGPGALGHAEDTLFSLQVRRAGFRIVTRFEIEVEHHLQESRLTEGWFRAQAKTRGDFGAYVEHHFEGYRRPRLRMGLLKSKVVLLRHEAKARRVKPQPELPPLALLDAIEQVRVRQQLLIMRRESRKYLSDSALKIAGELPPQLTM